MGVGTVIGGTGIVGGTVIGSSQLVAQPGGTHVLQGHMMEGLPVTRMTRTATVRPRKKIKGLSHKPTRISMWTHFCYIALCVDTNFWLFF